MEGSKELLRVLLRDLDKADDTCSTLAEECSVLEQSISLAKKCLEESLQRRQYIESLLAHGLSEVLESSYEFKLDLLVDEEQNIKGIRPLVRTSGGAWRNPQDCFGASVVDVVNLLLTVVCNAFVGKTVRFVWLDETLSHVGSRRQARLESLLRTLCKGLDLQLVMNTHQDSPFGKVYEVQKLNGVSRVRLRVE